ncbi:MAG: hypothetical protein KDJ52_12325 [Anaerolineae bacterium]|nr:hypothetical protein [Anaerolineae bacterium]
MFKKLGNELQIFLTLAFAIIGLIFLSMSVRVNPGPELGAEPTATTPAMDIKTFREKMIAEFGITEPDVQAAAANLSLSVSPSSINASPGGTVVFTVNIKNNGASSVSYIFFESQFPEKFELNSFSFNGGGTPVNDGATTWFIPGPIAASGTVQVTVTGKVAANSCEGSESYVTRVYPLFEETNVKQASSTLNVVNADACGDIYIPLVSKMPTPTAIPLFYSEDFSDGDHNWPTGDFDIDDDGNDECSAKRENGKYEVTIYKNQTCFFPAPEDAEKKIATYEVEFTRDGDSDSDEFDAGIYVDGKGGDEFYLFRIEYEKDDCVYRLFRKKDSKASGSCDSQSNGYKGTNKLRITRASGGNITIYLNDEQLRVYDDSSPLSGKGTGVYVRETANDGKVVIDFDNFKGFNIDN